MIVVSVYTGDQEESRTGLGLISQFEGCLLCFHTKNLGFRGFFVKKSTKIK